MKKLAIYFVYIWPEPKSSAAGIRSIDLLLALRDSGYEVIAISPSKLSAYSEELNKLGIKTISFAANQSNQDSLLESYTPDIVLFDRFVMEEQFGWKCRNFWPKAAQFIDTQDLHFVRRARETFGALESWDDFLTRVPSEDQLRELSALYRADGAFVVSTWEHELLLRLGFPQAQILYLPLFAKTATQVPSLEERNDFCFLGNFRHGPNADAVAWLNELWPDLLAQFPEAKLHLYGAYPPQSVSQLSKKKNIFAHGPVDDHRAAIAKHRVLIAPLRFGAGIKGKILEAWSTGTPVLGTSLAFEGMQHTGITFTSETFVSAAKSIYQDKAKWEIEQVKGLHTIEKYFSADTHRNGFINFMENISIHLNQHRRSNLTGQMLRHHFHNSTKYFSRWIEEKNKRAD